MGVLHVEDGKAHRVGAKRGAAIDLGGDFLDAARLDGAHALDEGSGVAAEAE